MADRPASPELPKAHVAALLLVAVGVAEIGLALFGGPLLAFGLLLDPVWAPDVRLGRSAVGGALLFGAAGALGVASLTTAVGLLRGRSSARIAGIALGTLAICSGCPPLGLAVVGLLVTSGQQATRRSEAPPPEEGSPGAGTAG